MNIVKIDPNKKYVLLLPEANMAQTERIVTNLRSFIEDDVHVIFAISGTGVIIVPADQVVLGGERVMEEALRVIALSYKYRIDKAGTPPHEYARAVLEKLGISLDQIPEGE